MGMGAFAAVAQGSVQPPKFIHMKYSPTNPKKKLLLSGKDYALIVADWISSLHLQC